MATPDPLIILRASIASNVTPTLSPTNTLATATDLTFPPCPPTTEETITVPLSTPTRFTKDDGTPAELRSIYFAWLQRDTPITDYIASAQTLGDGVVTHLSFIERLELVTYLEGGQEESDRIKALPAAAPADVQTGAGAAPTAAKATPSGTSSALVGKVRTTDPRLLEIYSYERVILNRNTMLRGVKPTDFSHVRKQAEDFISRLRAAPKPGAPTTTLPAGGRAPPSSSRTSSSRGGPPQKQRPKDPIILLSPSASSLLTMSNIKPFLEQGQFQPPQVNAGPAPQIIHISRLLPSINPVAPIRFIVVDSPEKFKPDYWERVVAVFTTGQEWQFRTYKWSNPVDLFREVRGFYVGWEGERPPDVVRRWGTGVQCFAVDRGRRFRDREVCEKFWEGVQGWMRLKGWGR